MTHRLDMDDELAGALGASLDLAVRHIGLSLGQNGTASLDEAIRRLDAIKRIHDSITEVPDDGDVQHLDK